LISFSVHLNPGSHFPGKELIPGNKTSLARTEKFRAST
jgi:hypothetical protein